MSFYEDPTIAEKEIQEDEKIDIKRLLYKYLSYWKWIIASFVLFLLLAGLYLSVKAPTYEVNSTILIKTNNVSKNILLPQLGLLSGNSGTDNEVEVFKSYTIMKQVVTDLNLTSRYYVKDGLRTVELYDDSPIFVTLLEPDKDLFESCPIKIKVLDKNNIRIGKKTYPVNTPIRDYSGAFTVQINDSILTTWEKNKSISVYLTPLQSAIKNFQEQLTAEQPTKRQSTVLHLAQQVEVPKMGIDILTGLLNKYDSLNIADKNLAAAKTQSFIDERIKIVEEELKSVEENIEIFKSANKITSIGKEGQLFLEAVKEKDEYIDQINRRLGTLRNIEEYISGNNPGVSAAPATLGITDPTLLQLITQLTELEASRIRNLQTVRPDNPIIVAIEEQIENLKRSIYANIQTHKKSLETTKNSVMAESARLENIIQSIPQKERQLLDIARQQSIKNQLYLQLLSKREEIILSYASTVSDNRIIDAPVVNERPIKPKKFRTLLIFGFLGLVFPIGCIYIKDLLQSKIESKSDITERTPIPILGEISYVTNKQSPILIDNKKNNKQSEQIRTLRTNLQFLGTASEQPIKTILFTSSTSGEGKTLISLNLGASLALTGKKVVILGLDMRRPLLQVELELHNTSGLSLFLAGTETDLKKITYPISGFDNYFVIPAGPIPPNPIELLLNQRTDLLFSLLDEEYDYIVIDSPPVGLVSDPLILSKYASITLYVVRQHFTEKESIKYINNLHKEGRFKKIGIINNGIKDGTIYYGYKQSDHYYVNG